MLTLLDTEEEGFQVNWENIFHVEPVFEGVTWLEWLTKPMFQLIIAALLISVVWIIAARRLKVVPSKGQWGFEFLYDFIRNGIARDIIGHGYQRWTPLLVGTFFVVLVSNWFGEFFYLMLPTLSSIGFAYGMAIAVWLIYVFAGFQAHGVRYLKNALIPEGVPAPLLILIIPLEFLSNFITRPFTLSVRVFANMFAGHLQVFVFIVGGTYLINTLIDDGNVLYGIAGGFSWILGLIIMLLELFIGALQAYVFTVLTAQYISSSVSVGH